MKKSFQILSAVRTEKRILIGICGIILLSQTGCIREGGHCYCQIYLYIVAEMESADYNDKLNGADLFLSDNNRTYISSMQISAADIAGNVPVRITCKRYDIPWEVVCGNPGDGEQASPASPGSGMGNTETIVVSPKTGRIEASYDSYDFTGDPLSGEAVLKLDDVFQGRDPVVAETYHMFHFPPIGTDSIPVLMLV